MSATTTRCARCGMLPEALIHTGDHPTNCHPFTTTPMRVDEMKGQRPTAYVSTGTDAEGQAYYVDFDDGRSVRLSDEDLVELAAQRLAAAEPA